ncbi:MAG: hypothetical protein AMJ91_02750 [candidate division Zixibacteria bacterium SM23_73_3]|nr:MAG: hypothetical protein AMJ91_02750 [candidate division Zixibacteria bacterium SM23_73_3]
MGLNFFLSLGQFGWTIKPFLIEVFGIVSRTRSLEYNSGDCKRFCLKSDLQTFLLDYNKLLHGSPKGEYSNLFHLNFSLSLFIEAVV